MKTFLLKHSAKLSKKILVVGALIYFAFGFKFLFIPDIITTMEGIVLPDRPAANHVRAVYGGRDNFNCILSTDRLVVEEKKNFG